MGKVSSNPKERKAAMTAKTEGWTPKQPINMNDNGFLQDKYRHYDWLRQEAPVYRGKLGPLRTYMAVRYEDCETILKDPRFGRDRKGSFWLWFLPKGLKLILSTMIYKDGAEHRRLRNLVHKAFTPRAIERLDGRIEEICNQLLDEVEAQKAPVFDLVPTFAFPLPVTVIGELLGIPEEDMDGFEESVHVLLQGLSGWRLVKTLFWDLGKTVKFIKKIIHNKRKHPGEDILTGLIEAEEGGDRLSEDELVGMVMLLVIAGYETTVDLIKCCVVALLSHPEQLQELKDDPSLMDGAIAEVMRYWGPVHGTELVYAKEEVTLGGVTIPKGHIVTPMLGAANRDPDVFEDPDRFDIKRTPNKHLGFGKGIHYCLGAPLAKLETKIALKVLFSRFPDLHLAKPLEELHFEKVPLFHRFKEVPLSVS